MSFIRSQRDLRSSIGISRASYSALSRRVDIRRGQNAVGNHHEPSHSRMVMVVMAAVTHSGIVERRGDYIKPSLSQTIHNGPDSISRLLVYPLVLRTNRFSLLRNME